MARNFTEIAFTPSVKAAQERYGSRAAYSRVEQNAGDTPVTLGDREKAFVEARDGFYQATVSETGWPYVQFRGGPAGFLKVLDDRTIGYADFRGNVQYLSVGNISANDRVTLILMDYANRARLKIWARARLVHPDEDPDLLRKLEVPTYRARVRARRGSHRRGVRLELPEAHHAALHGGGSRRANPAASGPHRGAGGGGERLSQVIVVSLRRRIL